MPRKYRLNRVHDLRDKDIFFDANVLIYLFWPTGQYNYEENYARVFKQLLKSGNGLFLNFSVISEVVNRVVRIELSKFNEPLKATGNPTVNFKTFRNSEEGKGTLTDIYLLIKENILPKFEIIDKNFDKGEIEELLSYDRLDFNDKGIRNICKENDLVLLTNDSDFKNSAIDILSGHPAFF